MEHEEKLKARTAEKEQVQHFFEEEAEHMDSLLSTNKYLMQKTKNSEKMIKDLQVSNATSSMYLQFSTSFFLRSRHFSSGLHRAAEDEAEVQ